MDCGLYPTSTERISAVRLVAAAHLSRQHHGTGLGIVVAARLGMMTGVRPNSPIHTITMEIFYSVVARNRIGSHEVRRPVALRGCPKSGLG